MIDINDIERLCMGCHKLMNAPGGFCEFCGYDNSKPQSPHHLPPHTILAGKYMVGRVLGEGGFGITYLGFDLNLQIKVAIKEYYPNGSVSRETTLSNTVYPAADSDGTDRYQAGLEKFLSEARSMAKFHDMRGIVEVRDFFRENGTAYIVMEYLHGQTLAQELKQRQRIPANEVFARFEPMIKSLCIVHKNGIIHRDISPDNIMSLPTGELKLLDFGAAKELDSQSKSVSVMLKPGYAPEEQYRIHGDQGPWTDCYALCATIYKLITGVTPQESLERLADDRLASPSSLGVDISFVQEQAIIMGMGVKKEDRFKSIDALYNALYAQGIPDKKAVRPQPKREVPRPVRTGTRTISDSNAFEAVQDAKIKKSKTGLWVGLLIILLLAAAACIYFFVIKKPNSYTTTYLPSNTPSTTTGTTPPVTPTDSGSLTQGFSTAEPEPTIGAGIDTNAFSIPNFELYTGMTQAYSEQTDEGMVYVYYMDESALMSYYIMLSYLPQCQVTNSDDPDNLFMVGNNAQYISFNSYDGFLKVTVPYGFEFEEFEAPVSYRYLENNGLTYSDWLYLADDKYCSDGVNYRGNTSANIINGTCVAAQGEYLYYSEYTDSGYLYRQSIYGGEPELLLDEVLYAMNLSVKGDYLYFTTYSDIDGYRSIYRLKIAGAYNNVTLLRENAIVPTPIGDYIYFKDASDNSLRRMKLDGSNEELVVSGENYFINVIADKIYVCDTDKGVGIYSVDTNTFEQQLVLNEDVYQMLLIGDFIYYLSDNNGEYTLYRYNMYSQTKEAICDYDVESLNTDGNYLYFTTSDKALYSIPVDGGEPQLLIEDAENPMVISNDYVIRVFYISEEGMTLKELDLSSGVSNTFIP